MAGWALPSHRSRCESCKGIGLKDRESGVGMRDCLEEWGMAGGKENDEGSS